MTDQQHPITPPPELVRQWDEEGTNMFRPAYQTHLCTRAARWGADQELEACCEWTQSYAECGDSLRLARRPKPPSLKEVALEDLRSIELLQKEHKIIACTFNIRRALEALPND